MATVSAVMIGCQSSSGSDDSGVSEWDKIETAQPAEASLETVNDYLIVSKQQKGIQSAQRPSRQMSNLAHDLLDTFGLEHVQHSGKQTASSANETTWTDVFQGNISGTNTRTTTLDEVTGNFHRVSDFNHYHDDSDTDTCGNPDETEQHGIITCDGTSDPASNYLIDSITCTMTTDLQTGTALIKAGSRLSIVWDVVTDRTVNSYTLAGSENGESFAFVDANETVWDDGTYEYSYISTGKIYFNDLSEYFTVDTSHDTSSTPLVEEICTGSISSGTEYFLGKDDGLIELNITSPNILQISIDADRDGTWETVTTVGWDEWTL